MSKFFKINKSSKDIIIIDEEDNQISHRTLYKKVYYISNCLKSNSVVLIIADNCLDFIASYISSMNKYNVITILLDNSFNIEFINHLIKVYKPNFIISPNSINFRNLNVIKKTRLKNYQILLIEKKFHKKLNFLNYLLLSTSGSTQNPKFVRLSKENISNNTKNIIKSLAIKKKQTTITTMPAGYSYGLSIINTHLKIGAKIVLNNHSVFERLFWNKIKKFKVNSFGGVPEFYNILKKIDFAKFITRHIKYLSQAGGKLNIDTLKYFGNLSKNKKTKFYIMYGQTEASPRISCLDWKFFFKKIGSVGKALNGYKIKIFKNNKEIKKPLIKGEIVLEGKNVSLGYAKNLKDLFKGDINKKILFTGDIGFKDKENFIFLSGRKKRFVKIFGKRFNLDDIESYAFKEGKKIICKIIDNKLNIELNLEKNDADKIIDKISKKFLLNKNFISISERKKSFKNYA